MTDWSKMPKPDERGEYATEAEAAMVRRAQLRDARIFSEGGDPFIDNNEPLPRLNPEDD